jgi:endonuclease YncB( thermonuclease family)
VNVHDGDTITVSVTRTFNVRLIDVRKAELNTDEGKLLQQQLEDKILGKEVLVQIPFGKNERLMDWNSFTRVLGHVWFEGEKLE